MNRILAAILIITHFYSCSGEDKKLQESASVPELKQMSSPADSNSAEPFLFTDENGQVYFSWISKKGDTASLNYSVLKNESWAPPVTIASGTNWFVNWADYPQIVADGKGNLLSHFLERSDTGKYTYDVKIVSTNDGNIWNKPAILHNDGKQAEHGFVSMIPYNENFIVTWLDGRNTVSETMGGHEDHDGHHGAMTLRAAIINNKGEKINEWELDGKVCDCCQTAIAYPTAGPVVVYRDRSDKEIRDMSVARYINGEWTEPKSLHNDNWKIEGCPVNGPRISALGNTLAVAWFTSPEKKSQVNIIFSDDGGAIFGKPIRVDEGRSIGRVDVEMLDQESAMVCWMEGAVIKAVKVYKDGRKDSSITISTTSETRSSGFPQMTKTGNKLIFAWTNKEEKRIMVGKLHIN